MRRRITPLTNFSRSIHLTFLRPKTRQRLHQALSVLLISCILVSTLGPGISVSTAVAAPNAIVEETKQESSESPTKVKRKAWDNTKYKKDKKRVAFEQNVGQVDPSVQFLARTKEASILFSPAGLTLAVQQPRNTKHSKNAKHAHLAQPSSGNVGPPARTSPTETLGLNIVNMQFIGSNTAATLDGVGELRGKVSYFLGDDKSKWRTDITTYSNITYEGLYPGIDLTYDGSDGQLKGTYTVAPGADPTKIHWKYEGTDKPFVSPNGDLHSHITKAGTGQGAIAAQDTMTVTEQAPLAWQEIDNQHVVVDVEYVVAVDGSVNFKLGSYDKAHPLILDPYIGYSTYLGGNGDDEGYAIATDDSGYVYTTGFTASPNFPGTSTYGNYHTGYNTFVGQLDAFVVKMDPANAEMIYLAYLGGTYDDIAYDIAVDNLDNAYVTGLTQSDDFPTKYPFQSALGDFNDAFVTKLNSTGTALEYSTHLTGVASTTCGLGGYEYGFSIAVNNNGHAFVTGTAESMSFPTTANAVSQQATCGGKTDVFITVLNTLNTTGAPPVYSTYLKGDSYDYGESIAIDTAGKIYVSGRTQSSDFGRLGSAQPTKKAGTDGFIAKIDPAAPSTSGLVYSTYVGGNSQDAATHITVNTAGAAYVTGFTSSSDNPQTVCGEVNYAGSGSEPDAFVLKLVPSGSYFEYYTRLGGAGADYGFGLEIDHRGNIYVSGATTSSNFPKGSSQSTTSGGSDAFLTKIVPTNACPMTLDYTMFVGGAADDHSYDVALDKWGFGIAFITGSTESSNFHTVNPYQPVYGGNVDAFITMVAGVHGLPPATLQPYELRCGGSLSEAATTRSAGNSVNTATGNLCYGGVDIAIPAGHGLPLVFGRTYNSDLAEISSPLGYGWTFNYNMYVEKDEVSGIHFVHEENGSVIPFGADFSAPTRVMATLANNSATYGDYVFVRPGAKQTFTFEAGHAPGHPEIYKLKRIEDRNGYITQLKYHASSGLLEEVTDHSGRTLNLHYNTEGPLTGLLNWIDAPRSLYDPTGTGPLTVHFDYDADGNLEEVTDVAGNPTGYGYSPGHLLHTVTDPRGKVLQTDYYDDKRVKKQIDPMARTVEFGYSGVITSALTTWITDSVKLVNIHKYDHFMIQEVTEHVGPKQAVWKYGYKPGTTWVSKVTDPHLRDWTYDYDDKGTQTLSVDPLGRSTTATTIPQGYLFHNVTDARGNTTTNLYDDYGNLIRVERLHQESGELASVNFTTDNNIGYRGDVREIYSQEADNEQTELIYDYEGLSPPGFCEDPNQPPFGYLRATIKRPTNDMSWVCYDNLGLLQRTRDTKGNDTSYVYNAYGDPIEVTDPLGGVTEYRYDANRNLKVMTDTAQTVTKYDYNDNNELTRILYHDLTHEDFEYDAAGRVMTQTNALGKRTITHYDDVNRQVKVTDPLTRETITRYDLVGNAATIVDAKQLTVTLGYDKAYQLKTVDYSDPTTPDVAYDYNEVGARSFMTDSTGVTRYEYDSLNRLDYVVDGAGRKVDYSYDLDNRLTTLSYPVVGATPETVTYDYDVANRRVKVSDWKSNSAYLTYDSNGNLSNIGPTQPSSTIPSTGLEYDKAGRVLTMTHSLNSTAFLKYGYDRHPTGLLQAARETSSGQTNTHTYGYDERYRLTTDQLSNNQAKNLTWDYDSASQIWQSTYHDPLNGLLTTSTRLYDAANQLRSITDTQELPATATPTKTATSTPTKTATPTPAFDGATRGLKGEYFARVDLTSLKFTAYDNEVNYNWGHASPDPSIPTDNYSIRWTGQVKTPAGSSGTYTFYTMSDDGVRLWVNGQQIVNNWTNHAPTENSGTIALEGGQLYDIKLEYYEAGGTALMQLRWQPPNGTKALLPSSNLYPASAPAGTHGLKSDFFLGQNLSDLHLTRYDGAVDYDWGNSYPDPVVPVDNFSARWTGSIQTLPQGGTYTFYTVSDDGVRLWVNDQLIINDWTVHAPTERSATIDLQGAHTYSIKLEFFENLGGALVQMLWLPPGGQKQVVPVTQLFAVPASQVPSPTPTSTATSTPTSRPSNCQAVTWAGMQNVTVTGTGNSIKKTSGGEWVWDATGVSSKGILSGDGSVQVTLNGGDGSRRHFGLGIGNSSASYEDVDYAFVVQNTGVFIWENNSEKANLGSKAVGDVLKVAVESGVVKYYINDILVYTSTKVPSYPLILDTSIANINGQITDAWVCGNNLAVPPTATPTFTPTSIPSNCEAVSWTGMQNVTVSGNSLTKVSGGDWVWDATGVSSKGILSGDGSVQVTLNGGDGSRRHFGLGIGNSSASYEDVDYAFVVQNTGVFIWENNSEKANLGSKAVGDLLKVAVENGVVKYYINDILVYTSAKVPTYPLIFDDSIANLGGKIQNASICSDNLSLYSGANNASVEAADAESLRRSTVTDTSTSDNSDSTQAANTAADSLPSDYNAEEKSAVVAVQATEAGASLPTVVPAVTETTKDKDKDKDKGQPEYFKPASLNSTRGFSKGKDKGDGVPSPTYTAASSSTAFFTPTFTPTPHSSSVATSMVGASDSVTAINLTPTGTTASSTAITTGTTGTTGTSGAVNATVTTLTADATPIETLNSTPTSSGAGAGTGSTDLEAGYEAEGNQQGSETQNHVFADLATDSTFYSYIQEAYGLGIVGGYPDGTFRPEAPASRGQFMKIIVLGFGLPLTTNETTGETGAESQHFIDVPTTHTFYRYIEAAYEQGIVSGYPGGLFKPEGTVTRGQVAKVVILAGRFNQLQPEKQTFTDVPSDSPFYTYIETAYANGILGGYSNGTFGPEAEATRGQISKIALLSARAARNSNTSSNSSLSGEGSAAGTGGTDKAYSAQSYSLNGGTSSPDGVGFAKVVDLSFDYDNNGNRISRTDHLATTNSTTTYKYNQANNLVTYDNAIQYQYNGDGLRMKKVHATATPYPQIEQYTWDITGVGGGGVPMLLEDSNASYVYGPGGLLLWEITSTGQTNRYHTDQLGSVRAITNSQGAVIASYEYDPYGNVISSTGSIATRSGYFGYAGEYTDRESKLVYLRARYYDPSTQQFINRDPLVGASGEPYGYVGGSPLNGRDPSGLWWETPLDILSLSADLLDIATNGLNWTNGIAIGADIVGLALPVVGGLGFLIRGAAHAGDVAHAGSAWVRGPSRWIQRQGVGRRTLDESELFMRYGSQAEASATLEARGLVPRPGHERQPKWISAAGFGRNPRRLGQPENYTHLIEMRVEAGTRAWLDEIALTRADEVGSYGIPAAYLSSFNSRILALRAGPRP